MQLTDRSCHEFTALLASKSAVPGGGGAAALAGALAAALGSMVGNLTLGKPKYAGVEQEMRLLTGEADALRQELLDCVQGDADAFAPLAKAYSIPRDDPARDGIMEECLRTAASVPMRIAALCCRCVELQEQFAEKGSALAVSDAAAGAALAEGALRAAAVNVRVNTGSMKDRAYAASLENELDAMLGDYVPRALAVYEIVCERFS